MRTASADGAVAALAASQHSAFGRRQAAAIGFSQKMIDARKRAGVLDEPIDGVLVFTSALRTWKQRLIIPTLIRPGGVVVSHSSAARLHGLDGFLGDTVHVTVTSGRFPAFPGVVVHRDGVWDENDHTRIDNIPCTNVARTLCDLGAVVKSDDRVEQALDDALRHGASEKWIRETLERVDRPGPSGTARLRRVLDRPDRAGALPGSMFERLVERACTRLPTPVRQYEVKEIGGARTAYLDVAWPEAMLGVEATSVRWHGDPSRKRSDKQRDMWLKRQGWHIEYPTWEEAKAPEEFVAMLESIYLTRVRAPRRAS
ncbi:MAG TPA: hypothetical protein VK461_03115 [Acidimicrobiales bacterium]|nr:hypothetical protein [Acidimicrobiales bacterium]